MSDRKGLLIIFSGPSGCGKDTVLREMLETNDDLRVSISMTTRKIRDGEIDGMDYYFVSREYFEKKIKEGSMLEYAEYAGNYYGTPKAPVDDMINDGINVILEIEVQGAEKIRKLYPDAVSVFLMPPSLAELEERLRKRGTDDEETISHRLFIAEQEIRRATEFQYAVVNSEVEKAVSDFQEILNSEKHKISRNPNLISEVINNV
ncbi:MAG: guanylate kinase [Clostridia bacterium]|nr:guanylate kinase [Clostridia bacterium]